MTSNDLAPSSLQGALRRPWPLSLALFGIALLALGALHADTVRAITGIWSRSETYAHGWLIPPIVVWLAWRARGRLALLTPRPWWPGLIAFAAVEALWLVATLADVAFVQHVAVIALIPATVLVLLGPAVARSLAFPLGYLVFAVPWGESFVPTLQDITAWMSVHLLELSQIPVYWEERLISIPVGDFEVAEACSGVRYLIASLALGALYAYLAYRSPWRRLAFLLAALLVPVIANGIRAYGIIMIAHWSSMRLATGVDHLIYGWIFFGVVMFLLFWLGSFWREAPQPGESADAMSGDGGRHPGATPVGVALAALVIIGCAVVWAPQGLARLQPAPHTSVALIGPADGWSRTAQPVPGSLTGFVGADGIAGATYRSGDAAATLLVVHYRRERQGEELINARNRIYGDPWVRLGSDRRTVATGQDALAVVEFRLARGGDRRLVWQWYEVGGRQTARASVAKAIGALRRLSARRGDATLVTIAADYGGDPSEARRQLVAFLRDHPGAAAPRGLTGVR